MSLYPRWKGAMRPVKIEDDPPKSPDELQSQSGQLEVQPVGAVAGEAEATMRRSLSPPLTAKERTVAVARKRGRKPSTSSSSSSYWSTPSPPPRRKKKFVSKQVMSYSRLTPSSRPRPTNNSIPDNVMSSSSSSCSSSGGERVYDFSSSSSSDSSDEGSEESEGDKDKTLRLQLPIGNPNPAHPGSNSQVEVNGQEEIDTPSSSEPVDEPRQANPLLQSSLEIQIPGHCDGEIGAGSCSGAGTGPFYVEAGVEGSDSSNTEPYPVSIQNHGEHNGTVVNSLVVIAQPLELPRIFHSTLPNSQSSNLEVKLPAHPPGDNDNVPTDTPISLSFPLPIISFTELDRTKQKYVDLLITTRPPEVPPGGTPGGDIFGHRIVLEQIPFFKPKLGHTQGEIDIIQVPGLNEAAVEAVVRMYYTHELVLSWNCSLDDIFAVLDKFEIVSGNLTYWAVRAKAAERSDQILLEASDRLIVKNFAKAIEYEDFLHVKYYQLTRYLSEGVKLGSSPQILLLTAILKWANYNIERRKELIFPLVELLDLTVIFHESPESRDKLRQLFTADPILASIPSCVNLHDGVLALRAYELVNGGDNVRVKNEPVPPKAPADPDSLSRPIKTEKVYQDDNDHSPAGEFVPPPALDQLTPHQPAAVNNKAHSGPLLPPPSSHQQPPGAQEAFDLLAPRNRDSSFTIMLAELPPPLVPADFLDKNTTRPIVVPRSVVNHVLLYPTTPDEAGICYLEAFDFRDNKAYPRLHQISRPRDFSCLIQVDNRIYDMGGACTSEEPHHTIWDSMVSTTTVEIFRKGEFLSKKGYCLKKKRRVCTANVIGGYIYVIGGDSNDTSLNVFVSNVVEKVDGTSVASKWNIDSYLQEPRSCHASAVLANLLYVAGGIGKNEGNVDCSAMKSVEVFSPICLKRWRDGKEMLVGRRCFRLHVMREKMYAIGGEDRDGGMLNSVEVFDPATNNWSILTNMNHRRSSFGILEMNGLIYVIGGNESPELSIETYDPEKNVWTLVPWPEGLNPSARLISSVPLSRDYLQSS